MFQHFYSLGYLWQIWPVFLFDQMVPPVQSDCKLDSLARKLFNSWLNDFQKSPDLFSTTAVHGNK